jgi:RimJ/RimL family protein N-acetyltransferase
MVTIFSKPIRAVLKDGTPVVLRLFEDGDTEALAAFYRSLPAEDRMVLKVDVTNRKVLGELVGEIESGLAIMILALEGDRIVGEATLHIHPHGWTRHVGELRLVMLREYSGRGLTRMLLKQQAEVANFKGLDKIIYRILDIQKDALRALEEVGFVKEAVLKRHATDQAGIKHDMIIMSNFVVELWRTMEDLIQDTDFEMIP